MLTPPSLPSLTLWLAAEKIRLLSPLPSLHASHLPTFAVAFATSSNTPAPDVLVHAYHLSTQEAEAGGS